MSGHCLGCGSTRLRMSRLRISDVPHLFLLRYPVRCHDCYQRTYIYLGRALKLVRKKAQPNRESRVEGR